MISHPKKLFRLFVLRVFLAEPAVFVHFDSVRIVLLIFHRVVVSLLALLAGQRNFYAHGYTSINSGKIAQSKKRLVASHFYTLA